MQNQSSHKEKKVLAILGSTGSIGTQALDVVRQHPERFEIYALTANNQVDLLIQQAKSFFPIRWLLRMKNIILL